MPLDSHDAINMLRELRGYPLLEGKKDIGAAVDIIMSVSRLVFENTEISELDLNPIMLYEKGASIVDAKIMLHR